MRSRIVPPLTLAALLAAGLAAVRADTIITGSHSGTVVVINGQLVTGNANAVVAKGPERTERRVLPAYTALRLLVPAEVTFRTAPTSSVTVAAPADILPLVRTEVTDGQLVIAIHGSVVLSAPLRIAATAPRLEEIRVDGSGSVRASGLSGPRLGVSLAGAGTVTARGAVGRVAIDLSGSGDVDVAAIDAAEVTADLSGSGDIRASARQALRATISGSGNVRVSGDPPQRVVRVSGSGRVIFR